MYVSDWTDATSKKETRVRFVACIRPRSHLREGATPLSRDLARNRCVWKRVTCTRQTHVDMDNRRWNLYDDNDDDESP